MLLVPDPFTFKASIALPIYYKRRYCIESKISDTPTHCHNNSYQSKTWPYTEMASEDVNGIANS